MPKAYSTATRAPKTNTAQEPRKSIEIPYNPDKRLLCVPWPSTMSVYVDFDGSWCPTDFGMFTAQCPRCLGSFSVQGGRACHCPWCGVALDKEDARYIPSEDEAICPRCQEEYQTTNAFRRDIGGEVFAARARNKEVAATS